MSRFLPHGHDPNVHKEEVLTLARTTSQQHSIAKVNGHASPTSDARATNTPRRKHFVFADPVAFRYEVLLIISDHADHSIDTLKRILPQW